MGNRWSKKAEPTTTRIHVAQMNINSPANSAVPSIAIDNESDEGPKKIPSLRIPKSFTFEDVLPKEHITYVSRTSVTKPHDLTPIPRVISDSFPIIQRSCSPIGNEEMDSSLVVNALLGVPTIIVPQNTPIPSPTSSLVPSPTSLLSTLPKEHSALYTKMKHLTL